MVYYWMFGWVTVLPFERGCIIHGTAMQTVTKCDDERQNNYLKIQRTIGSSMVLPQNMRCWWVFIFLYLIIIIWRYSYDYDYYIPNAHTKYNLVQKYKLIYSGLR
jgi:hypothetical protein